jgi:hypothetical protein
MGEGRVRVKSYDYPSLNLSHKGREVGERLNIGYCTNILSLS